MNALRKGEQSLCYSYCTNETNQNCKDSGSKYGNKCNRVRLKNGELIVVVAKHIIMDNAALADEVSFKLLVSMRAVNEALRKIREKLSAGLFIPGLSDGEMESLYQALENRDRFRKEAKSEKQGAALKTRVIGIMREHAINRMFEEGSSVAYIAKVVGVSKRVVRQVIEKAGDGIPNIIKEMYVVGRSISEIAHLISLPKKEVKKTLKDLGYKLKAIQYFPALDPGKRTISTIKPTKLKNKKNIGRRKMTVSREVLADWNKMHYDSAGVLRLPYGCAPPADLPKKFPSHRALVVPPKEPGPSFFPAPPPSRADCSRRGRTRMGYMRFF